jgi:hypothetical protein
MAKQPWSRDDLRAAMPALAVGAALRIWWVLFGPHIIVFDEVVYHELARDLASGQPYGLQIWPPGWPLALSLAYQVFGAHALVGMWLNTCASITTIALVGLLAFQLFDRPTARVALWIIALMPSYILLNVVLGYEVWLQFLFALACALGFQETWTWPRVVALACVTALATLVRPFWLILPVLLWVLSRLRYRSWGGWARPALAQLGALALVLPWVIHVSLLAGRFVPVAPNGGVNLWIGNNPQATGTFMRVPARLEGVSGDALAAVEARAYILAHPAEALQLLPAKLFYLLSVEGYSATRYPLLNSPQRPFSAATSAQLGTLMNVSYYALLVLALLSIVLLLRRRRWRLLLPFGLFVFNLICYLPFFGFARYRWPLQFLLIIYAAAVPMLLRARAPSVAGR